MKSTIHFNVMLLNIYERVINIELIRTDKLGHFSAICAKSLTSDVRLNADPQNLIENKSNHGKLTLIVSL